MANYLKPQSPLQHKDGDYFYPLTTIDQIITDNDTRLNAELISVDFSNAVDNNGEMIITNANMLNGKTVEEIFNEIINYSIVGGVTEPSNPTENMIWVNTDVEITKHILSKNKPKNPIEGMVWIDLSNNSNVSFHTLNINGKEYDEVYPLSVSQYIDGTWVDKVTKSYQGGKWVDWRFYIFQAGNGDLVPLVTAVNHTGTSSHYWATISNDYVDLHGYDGPGYAVSITACTESALDLSTYTKVCFDVEIEGGLDTSSSVTFGVSNSAIKHSGNSFSVQIEVNTYTPKKIMVEVPIETVNSGYIGVVSASSFKIYNWWCE